MLTLVLAVSLLTKPVDAHDPASPGEAELFSAAREHFRQRQYVEAIAKFEAAYTLGGNPVRLYNIGKCYERLSETGKALRYFREYLRLEPTAPRDGILKKDIANAEQQLQREGKQQVAVYANAPGAEVFVDQVRQESTPTSPAYVELKAGEHLFVVKAEGYETEERRLTTPLSGACAETTFILRPAVAPVAVAPVAVAPVAVAPVAVAPVAVAPGAVDAPRAAAPPTLAPMASPEKMAAEPSPGASAEAEGGTPRQPPRLVWTWVAGGAALAAGGTAAGLGVAFGDANKEFKTFDANRLRPQATELEKRTVQLATGTNIAMGIAGAAVVAAVILYFVEAH
jgi:tetratricopeptide (TPR) repeat protein